MILEKRFRKGAYGTLINTTLGDIRKFKCFTHGNFKMRLGIKQPPRLHSTNKKLNLTM